MKCIEEEVKVISLNDGGVIGIDISKNDTPLQTKARYINECLIIDEFKVWDENLNKWVIR